MNEIAIKTVGLQRDFKDVRALDQLSIEVRAGEVFGFLGPNGAGKTTTIRLLLGLLEPSAGSASVLGFDTSTQAAEIRQRSGALLEHAGLYERLSAEDNLEYYGRIWHMPDAELRARSQTLLSQMELWDRRKEPVGAWSRGMKQKLAVARALFHRPAILFLDEPTSGLDPAASAALRDDLAGLAEREGVTVFLTTHNLAEAEKLCSRVAVIRKGRLLAYGSPDLLRRQTGGPRLEISGSGFTDQALDALRQRPEVRSASLHNGTLLVEMDAERESAPLVILLVNSGAQIEEVRKGKASLEEVFLTLMEEDQ